MFKYRRLTIEELELLEESFIRFLAAQSITGPDWEYIQTNDPDRQNELIDQFSDVVIEKTLHNVNILEHRTPKRILFFEFQDKHVEMFGVEFEKTPPFQMDAGFDLKNLAELLNKADFKYSILSGKKEYTKDKKAEIFEVIQNGAQIPSNDDLFNFVLKFVNNIS